ncbi:transglutaminase domain-containing protein [candidate division WOR-3 bacterium]|nr:transglutaminase domain-containing protein [candidate division WOR-3 bacterium]
MKKIIGIFTAVAIVGISIYLLLQLSVPEQVLHAPELANTIGETNEEWLGIFLQDQRIGYSFTKITHTESGLTVESITEMVLLMMNQRRSLSTHLYAHTDPDYTLKDFIMELKTPDHPTKLEGTIEGKKLILTLHSQGRPQTQEIMLTEKPYFPEAVEEVIRKKGLKPGDEIRIPYFDPTTQSSTTARIKMVGSESVDVRGENTVGTRVEIEYMGLQSIMWLDERFTLIKESSPAMGLEMIPLTREQALTEIKPADVFDLLTFFAVRIDTPIADPASLTSVTLELNNISSEDLDLEDDYQKIVNTRPLVVRIDQAQLDVLPSITLPIQEHGEYCAPSVYIQCNDPRIINKAMELARGSTDAKDVTAHLIHGVYSYLRKNPTASLPSAIDVLATREGDCNEHAILFAALARALGIPTKIYVGLVNLDGSAYFYHAWCAVWLGAWVPVDPTFDQFPADVAHLKLKEGEIAEQAKVLKVVGNLNIILRSTSP